MWFALRLAPVSLVDNDFHYQLVAAGYLVGQAAATSK
jgi:hypothetical protein